jgi:hypothetical protein
MHASAANAKGFREINNECPTVRAGSHLTVLIVVAQPHVRSLTFIPIAVLRPRPDRVIFFAKLGRFHPHFLATGSRNPR